MSSTLTKKQIVALISSISDDFIWLLNALEQRKGHLSFPPKELREALQTLGVLDYQHLYESETAIALLPVMAIFTPDGFKSLVADYEAEGEQGRADLIASVSAVVSDVVQRFDLCLTDAQKEAAKKRWDSMTPDQQQAQLLFEQRFCLSLVTSFNQLAAVIVHGTRLTTLVEQAKQLGDLGDDAFVKAVQIDNGILDRIPFFRERWQRAKDDGNQKFLSRIGRIYGRPAYLGRIRHKVAYMGFALLQDLRVLDELKHREILDIFDESGINLAKERIEDEQYLTKRLIEFRRFQKTGVVSMH